MLYGEGVGVSGFGPERASGLDESDGSLSLLYRSWFTAEGLTTAWGASFGGGRPSARFGMWESSDVCEERLSVIWKMLWIPRLEIHYGLEKSWR